MTTVPDRTPFSIHRAAPVAGPGIEPGSAKAESAPVAYRQPARMEADTAAARGQESNESLAVPPSGEPPERRHTSTMVDLETVLRMLEIPKGSERDHLRSVLHIFNLLGTTGRMRVLTILNQMFK